MVRVKIILSSLLLTALIFAFGILVNYALDFVRIDTIASVMVKHELDATAYLVEKEFSESFGGNHCDAMQARIAQLKEEIQRVGADLGSYSAFSFFKKRDYDYLKRKYFLLELRFLSLIEQLNRDCQNPFVPIIFFYSIDDDLSERQGFMLEDINKGYEQQVVVLSIDKDYKDEPLVQLLVSKYNVTTAPTIIIGNEKREGLVFTGEINDTVISLLRRADPAGSEHDFTYVLKAAGRDVDYFTKELSRMLEQELSSLARADIMLILGRITKNDSLICGSLPFYDTALAETTDAEQQALVYETIASIDCGRNTRAFLGEAAKKWHSINATARAMVIERLAESRRINLKFDASEIRPAFSAQNASQIIIGETGIVLSFGGRVLTQADRVKRDWLGLQANQSVFGGQVLKVFSERLWYNATELREDIGWHEGGRINDLVGEGIVPVVAYGTLVARLNDKWFAMDDQGTFRFEAPLDKVLYPTTRFLRNDLAVILDTHGVNMLVEQAVRNRVDAVLSDCDHPGKVKAAKYLSEHKIPVVCFPDRFVYLAFGHNLSLVGSPPITKASGKVVIGRRPLGISTKETVVVMNGTDVPYALWYYQTPAQYFSELSSFVPLRLSFVQVNDFNQMPKVVAEARRQRAGVVAVRVFNQNDYSVLKGWLEESPEHRAVLFHSASYPYGVLLFDEFPSQTSFDDPNLRFVK
jgi:hypothetical protein